MKYTTINGVQTRYMVAGPDDDNVPEVVFLHGWQASSRLWLRTLWALRRSYRVWAVDLPGFGLSAAPEIGWYTIEGFTDHVAAFCREMNIRPYAMVGHSMGSRITLDFAHRYPDQVERLVLVSPTISGRLGFNLDVLLLGGVGKALVRLSRLVWPVAVAGAMSGYLTPNFLGSEGVKRVTEDIRRSSWEGSVGSLRALVHHDYSQFLADIVTPTLIVSGALDYTVPTDDARMAGALMPNAELVVLDRVHHWPLDEARETFMQLLIAFLRGEPVPAYGERQGP